jgi:hypothetical protein
MENLMPLRLSLVLPESDTEAFLTAIGLARRAPIFETFGTGTERSYRATFTDVAQSLEVVIRLIGEASQCQGAHATIDDREVLSLTRFWSALICYQESLAEPNPLDHCLRQSARVSDVSGCPDRSCVTHCQFICTRCLELTIESGSPPIATQLRAMARRAEVDWCPNLGFSDRLLTPDTRRTA